MSSRLRVVEILECGGPGGTGNQVAALCRGLSRGPFEIHLVYATRPGSEPEDFKKLARGAHAYHHVSEMVREISPLKDLHACWKLYRLFRRLRPDIVHAHSSKAGVLARLAACEAEVPRVYYSPRGYAHQQTDRSDFSRRLYRTVEARVSSIGEIVAVSESEASLARELTDPMRVHVIRDAYLGSERDDAQNPRARRNKTLRVCASGRLCFPRNPEAFVRMAKRSAREGLDLEFEWIGGGELAETVEELRRATGTSDRLSITGWLPQKEAQARLREADIFVHYSRWEGLSNAVLEALAAGLPIVASDIPGNREIVEPGKNGYLAANEEELAQRVFALSRNPEERARMGEQGRRLVREEFSRERMLDEYTRLYASGML